MLFSRLVILWVIGILGLCTFQSCIPQKTTPKPPSALVIVDSSFISQSLNEHVWVSTKLSAQDLTRTDLKTWLRSNTITVSPKKEAILLGNFRKYPKAWFYTQIINSDNKSQQLVVDEFNRIRCDDFEVLTSQRGVVKHWGRISRTTPFSSYPLPFFTFAVPFTIQPKDTLHLLVHSQRHFGAHEVNLNISTYETYLSEHIVHFLSKVFQVIVFVIFALIMFILGWIFNYKTMTYFSFYLLSIIYVNLNYLGFTDAITNFTGIGLSGINANTFALFISCFAIHPFLIEWMKVVPKNEKIFITISYTMMGFNLLCTFCYLLPVALFNTIYTYVNFPFLMLASGFSAVLWLFYCSLLAFLRVKVYYMLIGVTIIFLPWVIQQSSSVLDKSSPLLVKISPMTFVLTPVGLSIVCIFLLREQLISRKKYEKNLNHVRISMEEIRKTEIEAIGRNLHDNVGNILASAIGYLHLKIPKIDTTYELLKESINEIRFLSHNLVKDDNAPLHAKLESLVSRFNDFSTITFFFEDYSKAKINQLDSVAQQNIYMIVQEVLTNIIKHSKATEASIQVFETDDHTLQLTIEDDGIGILNFTENTGIGLQNIKKRAAISHLNLTIDSTPSGTIFIIETHKSI